MVTGRRARRVHARRTVPALGPFVLVSIACLALECSTLDVAGYRVHSVVVGSSSLEHYPHVRFEDRDAYLLGDGWYYRDPTYGWVVFDQEPPALREFREREHAAQPH